MALTKIPSELSSTTGIVDNSNATAITIDSNENVGIGTSSPNQLLEVASSSGGATVSISTDEAAGSSSSKKYMNLDFTGWNNNVMARIQSWDESSSTGNGYLTLHTTPAGGSATERMRIDASGNLLVGKTTTVGGARLSLEHPTDCIGLNLGPSASGTRYFMYFTYNGTAVGSIRGGPTSTAYNTSSDYRLKENVVELTGATERLKQLNPSRFNFIADADTTVDGFLAHEVADVVPEAISGTKDAMKDEEYEVTPAVLDEEGNVVTEAVIGTRSVPEYQGIDQSKLVPLLVATIQELEARITELENN